MQDLIHERDARAMVRMVADVAALRGDHITSKRYLMNGLREMIGADSWVWALGYLSPTRPPVYAAYFHEGFDDQRFARYLQAVEHPGMKSLMEPFTRELMGRGSQLTHLYSAGSDISGSAAHAYWAAADIAPIILSARSLNEQCVSITALYRRADQPMFSERERKIAHILLTEVSWMHATGWPEDFAAKTPTLSRARRLVLNLLLEGHSRKAIAHRLDLSIHTVSAYVKEIYAAFEVQSHAGLMRRFTKCDGA